MIYEYFNPRIEIYPVLTEQQFLKSRYIWLGWVLFWIEHRIRIILRVDYRNNVINTEKISWWPLKWYISIPMRAWIHQTILNPTKSNKSEMRNMIYAGSNTKENLQVGNCSRGSMVHRGSIGCSFREHHHNCRVSSRSELQGRISWNWSVHWK